MIGKSALKVSKLSSTENFNTYSISHFSAIVFDFFFNNYIFMIKEFVFFIFWIIFYFNNILR